MLDVIRKIFARHRVSYLASVISIVAGFLAIASYVLDDDRESGRIGPDPAPPPVEPPVTVPSPPSPPPVSRLQPVRLFEKQSSTVCKRVTVTVDEVHRKNHRAVDDKAVIKWSGAVQGELAIETGHFLPLGEHCGIRLSGTGKRIRGWYADIVEEHF